LRIVPSDSILPIELPDLRIVPSGSN
jgi:hypothetical protein